MRWIAAGCAGAAAVLVLLLGVALGWWDGSSQAAPARPLAATAALSKRALSFGDPLGARLELLVDPAQVEVDSIRVSPRFAPYRVAGVGRKVERGDGVRVTYRYQLECLEPGCLPPSFQTERRFTPAVVSWRTADGGPGIRQVRWPSYQLSSRIGAAERAAPAKNFRFNRDLPAATYGTSPATLRTVLAVLCVLLGIGAVVLGWFALGRPRPTGPTLSPLERALAAVRASTANGHVAERRRALGWLGRELGAVEQDDLARGAGQLAWSRPEPTPEVTGAFADDVEERT